MKKWDTASGVIMVSGRVAVRELRCEVRESIWDEEKEGRMPSREEMFYYDYEMPGLSLREDGTIGISADAALKSWTADIGGEHVSTVIRVPHGEPWPEQSWTGNTLCLVVQRQTLRCLILVLGRSRRVPGAWERIGIDGGPDPALFDGAERVALPRKTGVVVFVPTMQNTPPRPRKSSNLQRFPRTISSLDRAARGTRHPGQRFLAIV